MKEKVLNQVKEKEVISLAQELIRFPSFSGEETPVAEFLEEFMRENGIETELQEVEEGRFQTIGRIRGTGEGPSLALNGHIDIDPIPMGWKGDLWKTRIEGRKMFGRGLRNMKAGVTSMVMAAVAVKRSGISLKGDLIIECVVGELQGGVGTDHAIKEGIVPDYAIVTEPTELNIRTKHCYVMNLLIDTIGKSGWIGALHTYKCVNAVEKMSNVVQALNKLKFTCKPNPEFSHLPRMNIGGVIGGLTKGYNLKRSGYVPDFCTISLDIRLAPRQNPETALSDIQKVLMDLEEEDHDLKTQIERPPATYKKPWNVAKLDMPSWEVSPDEYIVRAVGENHKYVTGEDVERIGFFPHFYGGNDAGHLNKAGVKAITYGPSGYTFWEDAVDLDKMLTCAKVLALTTLGVCTKTGSQIQ